MNWGIIGLGNIAHLFVQDLLLVKEASIGAVASRNQSKANRFAEKYKVAKAYGNYQALLKDPDIDIIYIATPMIAVAQEEGRFLMEAFWAKFNPSIKKVLALIDKGVIGAVNYVNADFTFYREDPDDSRMLNMDLAGGSLLDMGVYPLFLAYSIFGNPEQILATGRFHQTGADIQTAAILKFKNGIANMMSGFVSQSDMVAKIYGTKGRIYLHPYWHETQGFTLIEGNDGNTKTTKMHYPTKGKGFTYEIEECMQCIQQGKLESPNWTHQNSVDLIGITDEIRRQAGLTYPFE